VGSTEYAQIIEQLRTVRPLKLGFIDAAPPDPSAQTRATATRGPEPAAAMPRGTSPPPPPERLQYMLPSGDVSSAMPVGQLVPLLHSGAVDGDTLVMAQGHMAYWTRLSECAAQLFPTLVEPLRQLEAASKAEELLLGGDEDASDGAATPAAAPQDGAGHPLRVGVSYRLQHCDTTTYLQAVPPPGASQGGSTRMLRCVAADAWVEHQALPLPTVKLVHGWLSQRRQLSAFVTGRTVCRAFWDADIPAQRWVAELDAMHLDGELGIFLASLTKREREQSEESREREATPSPKPPPPPPAAGAPADVFAVTFTEPGSLGLSFGTTSTTGEAAAWIKTIRPGTQAAAHPQLVVRLYLHAVDDVPASTFDSAMSAIKAAGRPLTLHLSPSPPPAITTPPPSSEAVPASHSSGGGQEERKSPANPPPPRKPKAQANGKGAKRGRQLSFFAGRQRGVDEAVLASQKAEMQARIEEELQAAMAEADAEAAAATTAAAAESTPPASSRGGAGTPAERASLCWSLERAPNAPGWVCLRSVETGLLLAVAEGGGSVEVAPALAGVDSSAPAAQWRLATVEVPAGASALTLWSRGGGGGGGGGGFLGWGGGAHVMGAADQHAHGGGLALHGSAQAAADTAAVCWRLRPMPGVIPAIAPPGGAAQLEAAAADVGVADRILASPALATIAEDGSAPGLSAAGPAEPDAAAASSTYASVLSSYGAPGPGPEPEPEPGPGPQSAASAKRVAQLEAAARRQRRNSSAAAGAQRSELARALEQEAERLEQEAALVRECDSAALAEIRREEAELEARVEAGRVAYERGKTAAAHRSEEEEAEPRQQQQEEAPAYSSPGQPRRQEVVQSTEGHVQEEELSGCTLHVRGVGGTLEQEGQLEAIFARFGRVVQTTTRHRVDPKSGVNTSWALVTLATRAAAQAAMRHQQRRRGALMSPEGRRLQLTFFDNKVADASTGCAPCLHAIPHICGDVSADYAPYAGATLQGDGGCAAHGGGEADPGQVAPAPGVAGGGDPCDAAGRRLVGRRRRASPLVHPARAWHRRCAGG
jgi:hypothetical protein